MFRKSYKYILDLALLPRRIEIMRNKIISIGVHKIYRFSFCIKTYSFIPFSFRTPQIKINHALFLKVNLTMFGPRTRNCEAEQIS